MTARTKIMATILALALARSIGPGTPDGYAQTAPAASPAGSLGAAEILKKGGRRAYPQERLLPLGAQGRARGRARFRTTASSASRRATSSTSSTTTIPIPPTASATCA